MELPFLKAVRGRCVKEKFKNVKYRLLVTYTKRGRGKFIKERRDRERESYRKRELEGKGRRERERDLKK